MGEEVKDLIFLSTKIPFCILLLIPNTDLTNVQNKLLSVKQLSTILTGTAFLVNNYCSTNNINHNKSGDITNEVTTHLHITNEVINLDWKKISRYQHHHWYTSL